jgi:hypothetical protein
VSNVFISGENARARMGNTLKLTSPTKLARLGHFPPASQAGRLAGPVFYVCLSSGACHGSGLIVTIGSEIVRVWAIRSKMKIRCEDLMMLREKIRELDVEG